MINLLESLLNIVITLCNFIYNTISSLIALIIQIPDQVEFLTTSLATLPPFVIPFATAFISINVILFILGKKGG